MKLTADQRSALALIAEAPRGVPESVLVDVHGFTVDALAGLVRGGLARVAPEKVRGGGKTIEVVRVMVTDAGRRGLAH
jgi:hypothetical protein